MNIEKYNKLHNEIMNRLEAGEITIETAKEVNDLAFEKYIDYPQVEKLMNQLVELSMTESTESLIDIDSIVTETFYGGNESLKEIEAQFASLQSKILKNPKGSPEIKTIESLIGQLFGFENVYFTVLPAKYMNACTVPFFLDIKQPNRKDFEIEKTANGIKYKDPHNKSLYVYMTSYTIEKFTPRECVAVLLHEIGHNFYAVEDHYKYARTRMLYSMIIQAILRILNFDFYGIIMIIDIFQFCKSPQRYMDNYLQQQTENYRYKAKDPGFITKALIAIFNFIGNIVGAAMSPIVLLFTMPSVFLCKLSNKLMKNYTKDEHDYLQEKFSDDFAASYGYATEVANVFKTGRKLSFNSEFISKIPILNLLDSYNDAVYNSTVFLSDPHPERHQRCVNMLNKLKYELENNSDTLSEEQKQQIRVDIVKIEEIIRKSKADKHSLTRFIQDKLGLVQDRDKMSSDVITDEVLFDFEEKIFGDKH